VRGHLDDCRGTGSGFAAGSRAGSVPRGRRSAVPAARTAVLAAPLIRRGRAQQILRREAFRRSAVRCVASSNVLSGPAAAFCWCWSRRRLARRPAAAAQPVEGRPDRPVVATRSARRGGCIAGRYCLLCLCLTTARRRQLCGRKGRRPAAAAPTAALFTLLRRRAERSAAVRDVFGECVRDACARCFAIRTFGRRGAR